MTKREKVRVIFDFDSNDPLDKDISTLWHKKVEEFTDEEINNLYDAIYESDIIDVLRTNLIIYSALYYELHPTEEVIDDEHEHNV